MPRRRGNPAPWRSPSPPPPGTTRPRATGPNRREAGLDGAFGQARAEIGRSDEALDEGPEVALREGLEHPPRRAIREGDDPVPVDHHDALADRPDDRVELRGPGTLRADQLGEAGLVGEALAERGGEPRPLPVSLLLGLLPAGDVVEGIDREGDSSGGVPQRDGAHDRPALLACRPNAEADLEILRRTAREHRRPGQGPRVHRAAGFVEQLEAVQDLRPSGAKQLVGRLEAARPGRGLVGVDEPTVGCLHRDAVGDGVDDASQARRIEGLDPDRSVGVVVPSTESIT